MLNVNLNVRVLRMAYNQFFVNIAELDDNELLRVHAGYTEALDIDEDSPWSKIAIADSLVPYYAVEDLLPVTIFTMVIDLYSEVVVEFGLEDPNTIIINKVEASEILAGNAVIANGGSASDPEYNEFLEYYNDALEKLAR